MAQPTATGLELDAGSGGDSIAKTTHGGFEYQWAFACWWEEIGPSPEVPSLASPFPVQPGTGITWDVTQSGSWTVTANLSATDNAVLDAIAASVAGTLAVDLGANNDVTLATLPDTGAGDLAAMVVDLAAIEVVLGTIDGDTSALFGCVAGNELQVDIVSSALPSGAATESTLSDVAGYLDTEIAAIVTAVQLLDNIVSGSEAQVDVVGSLPAGTNAIGKLTANSGVDIGDVDVTSVVPGTAASNLGKAEDAAHSSGDVGVMSLAVRNDDLAALSGTDGDYSPLQVNSEGALFTTTSRSEYKQASGVAAGGTPGTDNMVAAVADRYLVIHALALFATSTTTNTIYVDNADNDLIGNSGNGIPLSLDADGDTVAGFVLPFNAGGWAITDAVNEAITLNTSAAQDIIYCITYSEKV